MGSVSIEKDEKLWPFYSTFWIFIFFIAFYSCISFNLICPSSVSIVVQPALRTNTVFPNRVFSRTSQNQYLMVNLLLMFRDCKSLREMVCGQVLTSAWSLRRQYFCFRVKVPVMFWLKDRGSVAIYNLNKHINNSFPMIIIWHLHLQFKFSSRYQL